MKVIPQGYRMLVRLNPVEEYTTEGGIIVPDKNSQITRIGTILAVGDKVNEKWKVDDLFICDYTAGSVLDSPHLSELKPKQDTLRIIVQEDIMARIEEE